ncbi:hypothetical protein EVAR_87550_1 [Eumeta japonica]|uniref:Uncharacterized protein n=1 Tax=Eumeta variegata TaxID=151549 RepID=A0A4C1XSR2_EUMVA|nr:hypothetical protein EVAR_87550_1 [Eumeta japonica]
MYGKGHWTSCWNYWAAVKRWFSRGDLRMRNPPTKSGRSSLPAAPPRAGRATGSSEVLCAPARSLRRRRRRRAGSTAHGTGVWFHLTLVEIPPEYSPMVRIEPGPSRRSRRAAPQML